MNGSAAPQLWWIDEGISDPERFFALLPTLLPNATHLFIEGTSVTRRAAECYRRFADPGPYVPKRQTLWPRPKRFRCVASAALFGELSQLAATHAAPELLDHLSVASGDRMLLAWHDAFANGVLLDGALRESTIASLAGAFGCSYERSGWTTW